MFNLFPVTLILWCHDHDFDKEGKRQFELSNCYPPYLSHIPYNSILSEIVQITRYNPLHGSLTKQEIYILKKRSKKSDLP